MCGSCGQMSCIYIGWQWRNFDPYLCQLVFAAILWVNLLEMFATVILLKCALLGKSDHSDIFITQRIEFYLNNTINFRPLTPQIMPYYTHKVAILSWPQILWRHFTLCIDNCLFRVCGWNHCRVLNHWCQQNHNSEIVVSLCFGDLVKHIFCLKYLSLESLQCFDVVGWASGRASGL